MSEPTEKFHSQILDRSYDVWWERLDEAPPQGIILFLDGEFYRDRIGAVDICQSLVASKQIPTVDLLFVSQIDALARHRDYACCQHYLSFLTTELLPWATKERATESTSSVVLAGLSLSGLAAAFAAVEHSEAFPRVLCQSPSAWWNQEWLTSKVIESARIPATFWISVGDAETEAGVEHPPTNMKQVASQIDSCQRLAEAIGERAEACKFSVFQGGHEMECWKQELPQALRWLFHDIQSRKCE